MDSYQIMDLFGSYFKNISCCTFIACTKALPYIYVHGRGIQKRTERIITITIMLINSFNDAAWGRFCTILEIRTNIVVIYNWLKSSINYAELSQLMV